MQGIANFNPKYPSIYYITHLVVTPSFVLLYIFWDILNLVLENFLKNITTKLFLK